MESFFSKACRPQVFARLPVGTIDRTASPKVLYHGLLSNKPGEETGKERMIDEEKTECIFRPFAGYRHL